LYNPLKKIISRVTVKNDYITTYQNEKRKLRTLSKIVDKVKITTDMWTSYKKFVIYGGPSTAGTKVIL
jgi:hypothetical protein